MIVKEFEQQFKTLYLPLGMYALRLVGDIDIAEDIVQDSFTRAWEQLAVTDEILNFKSWMYRIVRNRSIDYLRSIRETVNVDEIEMPDSQTIDDSESDARVWIAVDRLPERCREIFLMSKRDGMTNAEIADDLGIALSTVKNQLSKALASLRAILDPSPRRPVFLPFL